MNYSYASKTSEPPT